MVFAVHMYFPGRKLAAAAESSHALGLSQKAIDWLGRAVDTDLRAVLELQPLAPTDDTGAGTGAVPVEASAGRSGAGSGEAVPAVGTGQPGQAPPPAAPSGRGGIR
jgi:hypothetical protein